MGTTVDEALVHAEEALRDYVLEAERAGDAITPPSPIERVETPAGRVGISVAMAPITTNACTASNGGRTSPPQGGRSTTST